MKITKSVAIKMAKKFNLNLNVIDIKYFTFGLNVELEHGKKLGKMVNITNNDLLLTAKIAIAHLMEFPDYYERLYKMENKAEKYWKNKNIPDIFIQ
jgi:hypothetical protein